MAHSKYNNKQFFKKFIWKTVLRNQHHGENLREGEEIEKFSTMDRDSEEHELLLKDRLDDHQTTNGEMLMECTGSTL